MTIEKSVYNFKDNGTLMKIAKRRSTNNVDLF